MGANTTKATIMSTAPSIPICAGIDPRDGAANCGRNARKKIATLGLVTFRRIPRAYSARGILMNVTNPKVAIFFLAFLPQFADPSRGSIPAQIVMLGAVFMIVAFVVFALIAWAASTLGEWLKRSRRAQIVINRVAGTIFVLLACRLAFARQ